MPPEPASEPESKASVLTVPLAVREYLANVEGRIGKDGYGASKKTLKAYQPRLSFWVEFDGLTPVTEVNQRFFERYRTFLRARITDDRCCCNIPEVKTWRWRGKIG